MARRGCLLGLRPGSGMEMCLTSARIKPSQGGCLFVGPKIGLTGLSAQNQAAAQQAAAATATTGAAAPATTAASAALSVPPAATAAANPGHAPVGAWPVTWRHGLRANVLKCIDARQAPVQNL